MVAWPFIKLRSQLSRKGDRCISVHRCISKCRYFPKRRSICMGRYITKGKGHLYGHVSPAIPPAVRVVQRCRTLVLPLVTAH